MGGGGVHVVCILSFKTECAFVHLEIVCLCKNYLYLFSISVYMNVTLCVHTVVYIHVIF